MPKKPKHTKVDLRQKNKGSARRRRYSLFFKLTVIDTVLALRDERGPTFAATTKVAKDYGIDKSIISKWMKIEKEIRATLQTKRHELGKYRGAIQLYKSRTGRRTQLGGGRSPQFPVSEAKVFEQFKEYRAKGLRVGPHLLTAMMMKSVKDDYGSSAAEHFKGGTPWRQRFLNRWGISLKRRSNKKSISAEERLPKVCSFSFYYFPDS